MIKEVKFHVSLNILSLTSKEKLERFCRGLDLFERWLKIFIFDDNTIDFQEFALSEDGIFLTVIHKNNYCEKFREVYREIMNSKSATSAVYDDDGLHFYVTGANHFSQGVIFLDFEDKCKIGSELLESNNHTVPPSKNSLSLQLFRMIHELIKKLCKAYSIKCDKKGLKPHCTLMKLSKMKRKETKKFLKHNRKNEIVKVKSIKVEQSKRGKNAYKVYDMKIMELTLNDKNVENKILSLKHNDHQLVTHIDLCQMQAVQDDGYYKIVQSFCVIP